MSGVIEAVGLTKRYGDLVAVDHVGLAVEEGSFFGVLGPNGAGKTTLIDSITGFVSVADGEIVLDGAALHGLPVHRRAHSGVRRTFQQERTAPQLTIGDYARLAAGRQVPRDEIDAVLAFIGAPPASRRISTVDVGTRRLVEVAGALAAKPRVLLLDEPAAGLTPEESAALGVRISRIPEAYGCSVLLIEHDLELVTAACTQVTVLDFGVVIARGSPAEVLADRLVIDAYLGMEVSVA